MPDTETLYLEPKDVQQLVVQLETLMENQEAVTIDCKRFVKILHDLYRLDDRIHICPDLGEYYFRSTWDDRDTESFHRVKDMPAEEDSE
tara:strand:- start:486 stop:752 length:267 start_codon:yes stop_codon:yes gene_type:complete